MEKIEVYDTMKKTRHKETGICSFRRKNNYKTKWMEWSCDIEESDKTMRFTNFY